MPNGGVTIRGRLTDGLLWSGYGSVFIADTSAADFGGGFEPLDLHLRVGPIYMHSSRALGIRA
jgi:hypothetical protein